MEWRDTGFVLAVRRHGERALIAELLTREHGRHAGLVGGGQSPRRRALLQPAPQGLARRRRAVSRQTARAAHFPVARFAGEAARHRRRARPDRVFLAAPSVGAARAPIARSPRTAGRAHAPAPILKI